MRKKSNDPRYETVNMFWTAGRIRTFPDIFLRIPKTVVANDLGMKGDAMNAFISNPSKYKMQKLFELADLIGVDQVELTTLAAKHAVAPKTISYRKGRGIVSKTETWKRIPS